MLRQSIVSLLGLILVAFSALTSPAWAINKLVKVYPEALPADAEVVVSRNGSSVAVSTPTGPLLIRNLLQFDQAVAPLPETLQIADVMALSYYGRVYARAPLGSGCVITPYSESAQPLPPVTVSTDSGCEVIAGKSNVVERFVFQTREKSGGARLMLMAPGSLITIFDSSTSPLLNAKIEGFAMNDLNTVVFTISHDLAARRAHQTWIVVPGRAPRELVVPARLKVTPVVLDVNNKNQFLVRAASGVWVFDPVRKVLAKTGRTATKLAQNGRSYSPMQLSVTNSRIMAVACLASGKLAGTAIQLLAVNEERELVVIGRGKTGAYLAKITPLTDQGFPTC